ncbi:hypothetical protein D3C80_1179450 [compost metagenome]
MQDRNEDFIERHAQHRRLIRRTAGIGRVINGVTTLGDVGDGEYREVVNFVVVTGVIAIRAFRRHFSRFDIAFQHDFRAGGHFQIAGDTLDHFGFVAAQQPGKGIFRQGIRHWRDRAENGGGICAQRNRNRETLTGMRLAPFLVIQRAAAVRQPTHDDFILAQHLLAINTQVLPLFLRPAGYGQAPGDQGCGVFRPAVHHRDTAEIDVIPLPYLLVTRR